MERSEFLQLQHAQQESLIHSWQQNLLRIKQKRWEITLKAETNGSGGAKNVLTKEEIENCDGIIVAADKNVEMATF